MLSGYLQNVINVQFFNYSMRLSTSYIDEVRTLPLTPRKSGSKSEFVV